MSKQTRRVAVPLREGEFKARLKKIFPDSKVKFVYSPIKHSHERSEKLKEEGCFGYHEKESILVDGKSIAIAWLPHVKDMLDSHLDLILERVEKAVREVLVDCASDSDVGVDSDSASSSIG